MLASTTHAAAHHRLEQPAQQFEAFLRQDAEKVGALILTLRITLD
jgi:hypothetical protein